jgi:hypothetical protein
VAEGDVSLYSGRSFFSKRWVRVDIHVRVGTYDIYLGFGGIRGNDEWYDEEWVW